MVLSDMVLPGTCRESKGQGHWSPWSSAASWIWVAEDHPKHDQKHGSLNVPIEHHPTIRYMVYNGYYKVMSNIPKMGQLPTPVFCFFFGDGFHGNKRLAIHGGLGTTRAWDDTPGR